MTYPNGWIRKEETEELSSIPDFILVPTVAGGAIVRIEDIRTVRDIHPKPDEDPLIKSEILLLFDTKVGNALENTYRVKTTATASEIYSLIYDDGGEEAVCA